MFAEVVEFYKVWLLFAPHPPVGLRVRNKETSSMSGVYLKDERKSL